MTYEPKSRVKSNGRRLYYHLSLRNPIRSETCFVQVLVRVLFYDSFRRRMGWPAFGAHSIHIKTR